MAKIYIRKKDNSIIESNGIVVKMLKDDYDSLMKDYGNLKTHIQKLEDIIKRTKNKKP